MIQSFLILNKHASKMCKSKKKKEKQRGVFSFKQHAQNILKIALFLYMHITSSRHLIQVLKGKRQFYQFISF